MSRDVHGKSQHGVVAVPYHLRRPLQEHLQAQMNRRLAADQLPASQLLKYFANPYRREERTHAGLSIGTAYPAPAMVINASPTIISPALTTPTVEKYMRDLDYWGHRVATALANHTAGNDVPIVEVGGQKTILSGFAQYERFSSWESYYPKAADLEFPHHHKAEIHDCLHGRNVVDLFCGTGHKTRLEMHHTAATPYTTILIDNVPEALTTAKREYKGYYRTSGMDRNTLHFAAVNLFDAKTWSLDPADFFTKSLHANLWTHLRDHPAPTTLKIDGVTVNNFINFNKKIDGWRWLLTKFAQVLKPGSYIKISLDCTLEERTLRACYPPAFDQWLLYGGLYAFRQAGLKEVDIENVSCRTSFRKATDRVTGAGGLMLCSTLQMPQSPKLWIPSSRQELQLQGNRIPIDPITKINPADIPALLEIPADEICGRKVKLRVVCNLSLPNPPRGSDVRHIIAELIAA